MCVAYKKPDGTVTENFPATLEELDGCTPVYEEFPGFTEDISKCESFDQLPENCQNYIKCLEELVGCRVSMVGIGPDRSQILER
jgi:adenylosuccinate synthase